MKYLTVLESIEQLHNLPYNALYIYFKYFILFSLFQLCHDCAEFHNPSKTKEI